MISHRIYVTRQILSVSWGEPEASCIALSVFLHYMSIAQWDPYCNKLIFLYLKTRRCKYYTLNIIIMNIKLHRLSWTRN